MGVGARLTFKSIGRCSIRNCLVILCKTRTPVLTSSYQSNLFICFCCHTLLFLKKNLKIKRAFIISSMDFLIEWPRGVFSSILYKGSSAFKMQTGVWKERKVPFFLLFLHTPGRHQVEGLIEREREPGPSATATYHQFSRYREGSQLKRTPLSLSLSLPFCAPAEKKLLFVLFSLSWSTRRRERAHASSGTTTTKSVSSCCYLFYCLSPKCQSVIKVCCCCCEIVRVNGRRHQQHLNPSIVN